jgi:MtrB/PioB family decaheme-associated outer membrane protein
MRISHIVAITALVLVPVTASAQQSTPAPAATEPSISQNLLDFGVRGSNLSGDAARYERYRDLGNGLFFQAARLDREIDGWFLGFQGDHLGALDQRLRGSIVQPGKFRVRLMWDEIPMLMSRTTQSIYNGVGTDTLFLSDAMQLQVQTTVAAAPLTLAQTQGNVLAGFIRDFGRLFDTSSRRHIAEGGFQYLANSELTLSMNYRHTNREGVIPFGGAFGHSNVVEVPAPIKHTLQDVDAGAEWMRNRVLLRVGYTGSFFHNDFTSLTFDNPWRSVDTTSASSRGRTSLPPSSSFFGVNGMASVTMPYHSRATAYVSMGSLKDAGEAIMPYSINTALVGLNPFPRTAVQGEGRTNAANLTFTSRPSRYVDISARYRRYRYDNKTPDFLVLQRVSYDNSVSNVAATAPIETEPFGITRHSFDIDARVKPTSATSAGIGYSRLVEDRTLRVIDASTENVMRVTFDAIGTRYATVRTKYEYSQKRGTVNEEALDAMAGLPACSPTNTAACPEQAGLRHFDIADRNRNRVTFIGTVMPNDMVSVGFTFAAGKDDYLNSLFGLRDNNHAIYGGNVDAMPNDHVTFSLAMTHEHYKSLSRSRQASPSALGTDGVTQQFFDATRNWAADGQENVNAIVAAVEMNKIREKVNLRFAYDFNRSHSVYNYILGPVPDRTLPEESPDIASTLPAPKALPVVLSELQRATIDMVYVLSPRFDIGVSYWYEHYKVQDFTLDDTAIPKLTLPGALLLGYTYRPYTANTVFGRFIVHF